MDFETLFGTNEAINNGNGNNFASLFDPLPSESIDPTLLFDSQAPDHDWQSSLGLTGAPANPPDFTTINNDHKRMLPLTGKSPRLAKRNSNGGNSPKHAPAQLYNVLKEAADQEAMARAERGQFLAKQAMAAVAYSSATGTSPALMPVVMDPTTGHTVALPLAPDNAAVANWLNPYRPNRRRQCSPHLAAALGISDPSTATSPYFAAMNNFYGLSSPPTAPMATLKVPMPAVNRTQPDAGHGHAEPMVPLMLPCANDEDVKPSPDSTSATATATANANANANASASSTSPESLSLPPQSLDYFTQMELTRDQFLKEASSLDFSNVTVLEMKKLLRKFSLNATGKKAALQERILSTMTRLKNLTGRATPAVQAVAVQAAEGNQTQHSAVTC